VKLKLELGSRVVEHRPDGEGVHHVIVPLTGVVAVTLAGAICVATGAVGTLDEAEARRLAEEKAEREYQVRLANALTRVRSAHRSPMRWQSNDDWRRPNPASDVLDLRGVETQHERRAGIARAVEEPVEQVPWKC